MLFISYARDDRAIVHRLAKLLRASGHDLFLDLEDPDYGSDWEADRATTELMREFYTNLIREQLSPAKSLRRAQLAIAAKGRWRHPFRWGAFVLLGDWRGVDPRVPYSAGNSKTS